MLTNGLVSVYFNATSRFMPYTAGDTMVPSRVFRDFDTHINVLSGYTITDAAESMFILGNMDSRPNGQTERSISVGDVIVIHTPDDGVPMAVEMFGFRQLSPEEWGSAQFKGYDSMVMR